MACFVFQSVIQIFANHNGSLSNAVFRTIRRQLQEHSIFLFINGSINSTGELIDDKTIPYSLHAMNTNFKPINGGQNTSRSIIKTSNKTMNYASNSVSYDKVQSDTTSFNDPREHHWSYDSDFLTSDKDTRQPTKLFRRKRSCRRLKCPSQNDRSLCPWTTDIVSNNTRIPQDIQIRSCVSRTPRNDAGLSDIVCENVTITKDFRLLNCTTCFERVVIPVGCVPAFSFHIQSPP